MSMPATPQRLRTVQRHKGARRPAEEGGAEGEEADGRGTGREIMTEAPRHADPEPEGRSPDHARRSHHDEIEVAGRRTGSARSRQGLSVGQGDESEEEHQDPGQGRDGLLVRTLHPADHEPSLRRAPSIARDARGR